jgi:hypothetical protein
MGFSGTRPNHEPGLGIYKNQRFEKIVRRPLWAPPNDHQTKKCRQVLKIPTPDGTFD